jgi:RimJ/RimL family protein N-acetyltransferase
LKNVNKVIGHLIFHKYTNKNIYEIGWIINKEYWNKGYAMEVSKMIIRHGFEELKLKKIIGETEQNNIKSIKTFEKIGMKKVGKNKDGLVEYEINHIN